MFKVSNKNISISIVNYERISHLVVVFLLLTLNMQLLAGKSKGNIRRRGLLNHVD